ncbi:MAG: hypothetical protein GY832_45445 [Chloroflexi bacterium]|nr:hypothetical protein [Chloroflexota bacterium]
MSSTSHYVKRSKIEFEALGIKDYLIAALQDGRAAVINRASLTFSTRPKRKLPLQGQIFQDYETAFTAIVELHPGHRQKLMPLSEEKLANE